MIQVAEYSSSGSRYGPIQLRLLAICSTGAGMGHMSGLTDAWQWLSTYSVKDIVGVAVDAPVHFIVLKWEPLRPC